MDFVEIVCIDICLRGVMHATRLAVFEQGLCLFLVKDDVSPSRLLGSRTTM